MDVKCCGDWNFSDSAQGSTDFALRFVEPCRAVCFQEIEQITTGLLVDDSEGIRTELFQMSLPSQVR